MDVDDCFAKVVGSFGKYQILIYAVTLIYGVVFPGITLLPVFIGVDPEELKDNPRVENDSSILVEWSLLDKAWVSDLIQALYFGGFLGGVVVFGQFSDKLGRRVALITGFLMLLPICVITSFSVSWQMFAALRFLAGFVGGGVTLVLFIYLQEIVERSWWAFTGSFQNFIFPMGILFFVFSAYFIPSWRLLIRFMSILQIPPLIFIMNLPESPRWLYSKGKIGSAENVLIKFARRNGVKNPVLSLKPLDLDKAEENYTIVDLFKHRVTLKRILIMAFIWFVNSFVYYAFTLAAGKIGSNTYTSEALSGIIEFPCVIFCPLLLNRWWCGRKRGVSFALLLTGFVCLSLMAFDPYEKSNAKMAVGLMGKLFVSFSFNSVYVYAPELFPTSVRNVALGSLSMFARIGGIVSSFAASMIDSKPIIGYFIFGACGVTAGLLTLLLPETFGTKPPNSFEELGSQSFLSSTDERGYIPIMRFPSLTKQNSEEKFQLLDKSLDEETFTV